MTRPVLAVFGGSFNPPHVGHQAACLWVLETQPVDRVLLVPTFKHPFDKVLAPFEHRVEMCRLAAAPFGARAEVSDLERDLGGESSRTLITLEALAARRPEADLRLVVGADILGERDKWYRWSDIERLAPPIVVSRPGYQAPDAAPCLVDISSTEIRARLGRGEPVGAFVSRGVAAYIEEHRLYR